MPQLGVAEVAVTSQVVTFEIMGAGPERRAAEEEMIAVAQQFEGVLQRRRVDGLYSPWM